MSTSPNYTLTGTIETLTGAADVGYALIQLAGYGNSLPLISGTMMTANTSYKASANSSGIFSVTLFGNDQLSPTNTYYNITLYSSTGQASATLGYTLAGGGTTDLSTLSPIVSTPATWNPSYVLLNATGTQTLTGGLSIPNLTVSSSVTFNGVTLSGTIAGSPTFSGNPTFSGTPVFSNTLALNTSGSAASLSISGQTGLLTFTGLTSSNRAKTVRDAADTVLELGGSYTPTGTWTSMTLAGGALSGTFTGGPTFSGNPAFTGTPTFSNALALGSSTCTQQAVFDNSTKLADTAYVDNTLYGGGYAVFEEDFLAAQSSLTVSSGSGLAYQGQQLWYATPVTAGTTGTVVPQDGTYQNPGVVVITTPATSGDGVSLYGQDSSGNGPFGALGSNAGWQCDVWLKTPATITNFAVRTGLSVSGQVLTDSGMQGIYVEYDTANGSSNSHFMLRTTSGGGSNYVSTTVTPATSTWYHFRIFSTSAGTIQAQVGTGNGALNSAVSSSTDVSASAMGPFFMTLPRSNAAVSITVDRYSMVMSTGRV